MELSLLITPTVFCFATVQLFSQPQPPTHFVSPPPRIVATKHAPKPDGPYSQAIVDGSFLFASGQTPRDPKTGKMVDGTFDLAVNRVFDNLEAILKAQELEWNDVDKVTVYLTRCDDLAEMDSIFAKRVGTSKPSRTTLFVVGLPGGATIGMDLVARIRRRPFYLPVGQ